MRQTVLRLAVLRQAVLRQAVACLLVGIVILAHVLVAAAAPSEFAPARGAGPVAASPLPPAPAGAAAPQPASLPAAGSAAPVDLGLGLGHTCWVTAEQTVQCWGLNRYGQLGNDDPNGLDTHVPLTVSGSTKFVAVAVGYQHTCALDTGGAVWCWGSGEYGQLGIGIVNSIKPEKVAGLANITAITAGIFHTCALQSSGSAWCWGDNDGGQLGNGTTDASARPTPVTVNGLPSKIVTLLAGGLHTCARLEDDSAACWGYNGQGQLGVGDFQNRTLPTLVSGLTNVTAVATGSRHTCALLGDKTVRCWGYNYSGQVGDGSQADRALPTPVTGLTNAIGIDLGGYFSCAVLEPGTGQANVRCWGSNVFDELGGATGPFRTTPQPVPGVVNAVSVVGGILHACARLSGGDVLCWGWNGYGQLGTRNNTDQLAPGPVADMTGAIAVAAGQLHACALRTDGAVWCWGSNSFGQLGDGTALDNAAPVQVSGITQAQAITAGSQFSCALLANKTVWCWGTNGSGELGNGGSTLSAVPVQVSGLSNIAAISAGGSHACALHATGGVSCWGLNAQGQLGDGFNATMREPVPVLGEAAVLDGVKAISSGSAHTCAVLENGAVTCWGHNNRGQLGDGTLQNSKVALPVQGVTDVVQVAAGGAHTCARLANGAVTCWGDDTHGQLGDGPPISRGPVLVLDLADVRTIESGVSGTCAVLLDGSARCWGLNKYGQLGDSTTATRQRPALVTSMRNAVDVALSEDFSCYALADGGLACTGSNAYRQLGSGKSPTSASPVLVDSRFRMTVLDEIGAPVAGAEVWIYRGLARLNVALPLSDALGRVPVPLLEKNDRVVALRLVPDGAPGGWPYRLYVTSLVNGEPFIVSSDGEQPVLALRRASPLLLFDLTVSLEWCDSDQTTFAEPQQMYVRRGLAAASNYLYDVTDGQFAFGSLQIYDCAERWEDADVQILASSYARPWANTGGIVPAVTTIPNQANAPVRFAPGHVRMGRTWSFDGSVNTAQKSRDNQDKSIWFDQPDAVRAFTHEFLHWAGFLFDQYVQTNANGELVEASCTAANIRTAPNGAPFLEDSTASLMYWPYTASELDQEGTAQWAEACRQTEQYQKQGESSWDTLERIYRDPQDPPRWELTSPRDRIDRQALRGPDQELAFPDLPRLSAVSTGPGQTGQIAVRFENGVRAAGQRVQVALLRPADPTAPDGTARIVDIVDGGMPDTVGNLLVPGYQAGDTAVAMSWEGGFYGLNSNLGRDVPLVTLRPLTGSDIRSALVTAQPLANGSQLTGLNLSVCGVDPGATLYAELFPLGAQGGAPPRGLALTYRSGNCYGGTLDMRAAPIREAHVLVCRKTSPGEGCIPAQDPFTIATYALSAGSPGSHGRSYAPASSNGYCNLHLENDSLSQDAPVLFMNVRSTQLAAAPAYRLVGMPCAVAVPPDVTLNKASLLLYYNETQLLGGDLSMLEVMRWTAAGWQPLQTAQAPDRYTYFTAQQITEPGIYAVMLKLPPAYSLRSQDLDSTGVVSGVVPVASIVQWGAAGPLDQALAGCTVLLVVDPQTQAGGSSRQYVPNAPAYVNTLQAFEAGKTYIVLVSANCTTTQTAASETGQSAASTPGQSAAAPVALTLPKSQMPALYYGVVRLPDGKPIAPGTRIQARVAGGAWGETRTFRVGADTVYVLSVAADDPRIAGPQGAQPGSTVEFVVGGATAPRTATWAGGTAAELNLTVAVASYRVFMPAVRR